MEKRQIWMLCLIAALLSSLLLIGRTDAMELNGLYVMSEEELTQMVADLPRADHLLPLDRMIQFEGKRVPFDQTKSTFYVSQKLEETAYEGAFTPVGEDCLVCIQEDEILEDKQKAISGGHVFKIWFVTKEAYAVADLIFTGLPVIDIHSDENDLTQDYTRGQIVIQNPNDHDVVTMSAKASQMEAKINDHTGTISFRLYKKDYAEERNLSLLGLGKRSAWKLYPVSEKDESASREMMAAYLWNCVCEEDTLKKGMEYAEVIVDGEYQGLYYLAPKIGRGYLNLQEEDCLYECEALQEDGTKRYKIIDSVDYLQGNSLLKTYEDMWKEEEQTFSQIDLENYMNYHIYLQAACAVGNSVEEYYVAARQIEESCLFSKIPERSRSVLGMYPQEIGWQSLFAAEKIIEDAEYDALAAQIQGLESQTAQRWMELRKDVLSTDNLLRMACLYEQRLADSGYIARRGEVNAYIMGCHALHGLIEERMKYLDRYYGVIDE